MIGKKLKLRSTQKQSQELVLTRNLGKFLQRQRLQASKSKQEVASYLNVTPETLSAYENGTRQIPLQDIYALSNCLNIDPDLILRLLKGT